MYFHTSIYLSKLLKILAPSTRKKNTYMNLNWSITLIVVMTEPKKKKKNPTSSKLQNGFQSWTPLPLRNVLFVSNCVLCLSRNTPWSSWPTWSTSASAPTSTKRPDRNFLQLLMTLTDQKDKQQQATQAFQHDHNGNLLQLQSYQFAVLRSWHTVHFCVNVSDSWSYCLCTAS